LGNVKWSPSLLTFFFLVDVMCVMQQQEEMKQHEEGRRESDGKIRWRPKGTYAMEGTRRDERDASHEIETVLLLVV